MKKKYLMIITGLIMAVFILCVITNNGSEDEQVPMMMVKKTVVQYERNGVTVEAPAVAGQIVMILDESESTRELEVLSHQKKVRVLKSFPEAGYFLLQVREGDEGKIIDILQESYTSSFICPNIIFQTCATHTYCLDNFNGTHGKLVNDIILDQGYLDNNHPINVGYEEDEILLDEAATELIKAIENASDNDKLVVNMSFEPYYRRNYAYMYSEQVCTFLEILVKYPGNDIVLVQASGNKGYKDFDIIILNLIYEDIKEKGRLKKSDSYEQMYLKALNESYIFVSAEDQNDPTYSNDVRNNGYHPLVTKVDITDWKDSDGVHHDGTSFAAPVITGIIAYVAESADLSVEEVLALVKRATKEKEDHIINKQDVLNLVDAAKKAKKIPKPSNPEYVDLSLSSGTIWASCNEGALSPEDLGYFYTQKAIEELYDKDAEIVLGYSNYEKLTLESRVPTKAQVEELMAECDWKYTVSNGIKGYDVIGSNGNSIFIPLAGVLPNGYIRDDFDSESEFGAGYEGLYWVSDNSSDNDATYVMKLMRSSTTIESPGDMSDAQLSVRPVLGGTITEHKSPENSEATKGIHAVRPDLSMILMDLEGRNLYNIEDWQLHIEDINSAGLEYDNSTGSVYAAIIKLDLNVRMLHVISKVCVTYTQNKDATWSYKDAHVISSLFPEQGDFSEYVVLEESYLEISNGLTLTNNSKYELFVIYETTQKKKKPEVHTSVIKPGETKNVTMFWGDLEYKVKHAYRI